MVSWFHSRHSAITFDVGAAGVRAYQFQRRGAQPRLCDALQFDRTVTSDEETPVAPAMEAGQLSRLIGQARFAGRDVTIVLSPPEVQFYPLRMPAQALSQSPERLAQALKWEVGRETRDSSELEVRYWELPAGRGQAANVMAVAIPSATCVKWCDDLYGQRLALRRIDVSPCALVRVAQRAWAPEEHDLWGILDLGLRHSTLTVVIGTTPTYIRSLSGSAHQWTERLATAFEVGYSVAEQLKREHGIGATQRGLRSNGNVQSALQAEDLPGAFSSVLREPLRALAVEVGRCFSYVMQAMPDYGVKRLLLSGGGAALRGLPSVFADELGIPVHVLASEGADDTLEWKQPLSGVRLQPHAAVSFGGAMLDLEAS